MMRYTINFTVDVESDNKLLEAFRKQVAEVAVTDFKFEGYVHSDGGVRPCTPPPAGYRLVEQECEVDWCQYEVTAYYAVPGTTPEAETIDEEPAQLPEGSLRWGYACQHDWLEDDPDPDRHMECDEVMGWVPFIQPSAVNIF